MFPQNRDSGKSVLEIVQDLLANLEDIARSEFSLAIVEIKEEAVGKAKASITLGVGVICAIYALGLLLLAAVYALATRVPIWLAALTVGSATAVVAISAMWAGRSRLRALPGRAEKGSHNFLKGENKQWENAPTN